MVFKSQCLHNGVGEFLHAILISLRKGGMVSPEEFSSATQNVMPIVSFCGLGQKKANNVVSRILFLCRV